MPQGTGDLVHCTITPYGYDVVVALASRTASELVAVPRLLGVGEEELIGEVGVGTPEELGQALLGACARDGVDDGQCLLPRTGEEARRWAASSSYFVPGRP